MWHLDKYVIGGRVKVRIYLWPSKPRGKSSCLACRTINQIPHQGLEGCELWVQSLCKLTLLRNTRRLQVNSPWPSCFAFPLLHMCFTYPQLAQVQWEIAVDTVEHTGCKPRSRSKDKKELLPAQAHTKSPSTVTGFGTRNVLSFVRGLTGARIVYT